MSGSDISVGEQDFTGGNIACFSGKNCSGGTDKSVAFVNSINTALGATEPNLTFKPRGRTF